jgi:hypothetical protein
VVAQIVVSLLVGLFIYFVGVGNEGVFALVPRFAVVFLMTTLFILASGFKELQLTDPTQALGLPTRSVRAMIAPILILVFIMFGTYLYTQELTWYDKIGPIETTRDAWIDTENVIEAQRVVLSDGTLSTTRYNVWFSNPDPRDSSRIAQQLITTVGSLVGAVTGFYFGSAVSGGNGKPSAEVAATLDEPQSQAVIDVIAPRQEAGEVDAAWVSRIDERNDRS